MTTTRPIDRTRALARRAARRALGALWEASLVIDHAVERVPALNCVAELLDPVAFWAHRKAQRATSAERRDVERFVVEALGHLHGTSTHASLRA